MVRTALYYFLVGCALAVGCVLFALKGVVGTAAKPWLLVLPALLLWPQVQKPVLSRLQSTVGFYLCCLPLDRAAESRLVVTLSGCRLRLSVGIAVAAFLLAASYVWRAHRYRDRTFSDEEGLAGIRRWGAAAAVTCFHAAFLCVLLLGAYGYGCEKSGILLGKVGLFFMAYVALEVSWANSQWRRGVSIMLAATYIAAAFFARAPG